VVVEDVPGPWSSLRGAVIGVDEGAQAKGEGNRSRCTYRHIREDGDLVVDAGVPGGGQPFPVPLVRRAAPEEAAAISSSA